MVTDDDYTIPVLQNSVFMHMHTHTCVCVRASNMYVKFFTVVTTLCAGSLWNFD